MNCPSLPVLDIAEWSESIRSKIHSQRYPLGGSFELTDRCNLRCVHCYINQPAGNTEIRSRELTTDQVKGILDEIASAGCLFLTLTGGEVLLRPDFSQIYRYARRLGMLVSVFTNGTLMTPEIADLLAEVRPFSIEITMYGATPETYERVTGVAGSFARCQHGIELLMERGLPLTLKTFVLTINRHELEDLQSLAKRLGVHFRQDGVIWPRLDGNQEVFKYQLSLQELVEIEQDGLDKVQEWATLINNKGKNIREKNVFNCGAGFHTFHINSQGRMSVCMSVRRPAHDLLQMRFMDAWELMGKQIRQVREFSTSCTTCQVGNLCDQCPGWSQAVHGDNETPVDFICKLGNLRLEQIQQHLI